MRKMIRLSLRKINIKRYNVSNSILLDVYTANTTTNIDKRIDLQESVIAKIKYLDFLVNLIYDKKIINSKRYLKFGEDLEYILKYVNGWKKTSIEGNEKNKGCSKVS